MRFLVALLALTLPAFAQIRYSPTGFTAPFISTVTNQASAQAYLGISGGGGGSVTNFGGSATNLQVYSSGGNALTVNTNALRVDTNSVYVGGTLWVTNTLQSPGTLRPYIIAPYGPYPSVYFTSPAQAQAGVELGASGDLAVMRSAAGLAEFNNGTAGTYRDLRLRTLYGEGGTVTASQPVLDISQTWNNAGVNFTAAKVNVTNTASGSASKLLDLQVGGVPRVWVDKNGTLYFSGGEYLGFNGSFLIPSRTLAGSFLCWSGASIKFDGAVGAGDSAIERVSAGVLKVTDGSGNLRDLVTRSTFATNASITNITADSYVTTQQTLSYASATNLTVDANKSLHFVSLTNTAYFAQPSNLGVGRTFTVILQQDGTGTRAVTFNTNYWKFPGGVVPTITTNANAYDVLSCISCPYGTNVFAIHNAKFQ